MSSCQEEICQQIVIILSSQSITIWSVCKTKHELCYQAAIKEFVCLKRNICAIIATDSSKYNKAKSGNKNIVAKTSHNDYKDVLLNEK